MKTAWSDRLPAFSFFAAILSAAGLPIYIYAPKYYADNYGVSLTALGAILFGLRLFDVVQDPVLGWISERLSNARAFWVGCGALILAMSMYGLFAVPPPITPAWWFGLTVTGLFTSFSFLTINFYAQGIQKADGLSGSHMRLAAWRETGALFGVCIAAVTPTVLVGAVRDPFATFAIGFGILAIFSTVLMRREWTANPKHTDPTAIRTILSDKVTRSLLILALVNATPLAVSSTLFLFFVESRLGAVGWEGPLLVLFFLSAALSAPIWSRLAQSFGAKALAVASFAYTLTLSQGEHIQFAIVCVLSGATIGADLTLLPALFAKRMSVISPNGGQGFGLWSLVNKFTLAFAAVLLLPLLENAGFVSGSADLPTEALNRLTVLYAGVPCALKLVAIAMLAAITLED